MNEVEQELKPTAVMMKIEDNETGEVSYKIVDLSPNDKDENMHSKEEWREMTKEEKKEWGIE